MTTHNRTDPEPVYDEQDYSNLRQVQSGLMSIIVNPIQNYLKICQLFLGRLSRTAKQSRGAFCKFTEA